MQKVVHGNAPQYTKDLMITSERLHVHGNKHICPEQGLIYFKCVSPFRALSHGTVYLIIVDFFFLNIKKESISGTCYVNKGSL